MFNQQTLVIIKPDGLAKGLVGEILYQIQSNGLTVVNYVYTHLSHNIVEELYDSEREEVYFQEVVDWVSSTQVLLLKIRGEGVVEKVKWCIIGRYPKGIRGQYAENWIKNIAHAPDSESAAKRELKLFESIFKRRRNMDKDLFNKKKIFALTGMSECGKSTVGKYFDSQGISRLKIVRLFERVRDKQSPEEDLYQFTGREEQRDPYALWGSFVGELIAEMKAQNVHTVSIESLYGGGLGPYLKKRMGDHFCIIYVDISLKIRLERQMQRERLSTIKEAKKILLPRDKIKSDSGILTLKEIADEVIDNSGNLDNLYQLVDKIIQRHTV